MAKVQRIPWHAIHANRANSAVLFVQRALEESRFLAALPSRGTVSHCTTILPVILGWTEQ
jgi:hypothetical protein